MPRKRSPAPPTVPSSQVTELVASLARLDAIVNQIELRLQPLVTLPTDLVAYKQLAMEALAQSQDALETSRLSRVHEDRLNSLTLAVAEGIQHVERAEARIRATVARARSQLREAGLPDTPGLEAEADSLRGSDGGRSEPAPVQPVRAPVEETRFDDNQPSAFPGLTRGQLRKMRGA